tara:strand:+ start:21152 stop:21565 length:414 start_codon:yes stop_codon:yes gene_type:complete
MTVDRNTTHELIQHYYDAFNAQDYGAMLDLVADDLRHDINQGEREQGKDLFATFLKRMDSAYSEQLRDIAIMTSPDGARAAAEFVVHGIYKAGDEGLPPAHGQSYILPAGAFFEVERELISRISVYYNLADWIAQVS